MMVRGTAAGFYQITELLSFLFGVSYTLYDFDGKFNAIGIFGGLRFNLGQIIQ